MNKKLLKIGDGPETRETELDSVTCCRDFKTKERQSEGREVVLGTLLKLLVKDKLLRSGKVLVQRYGTLKEAMKM